MYHALRIFMHNTDQSPLVERFNTNMRQCEFQKEDFELWRSALVHMYDEMQNQIQDNHASGSSYPQVWATKLPDAQSTGDTGLEQDFVQSPVPPRTVAETSQITTTRHQDLLALVEA